MTLTHAERDDIRDALDGALADRRGEDASDVLEAFGWTDLLASDPVSAVTVVFGLLGESGAGAAILGDVLRYGLGDLGSTDPGARPAVVVPWSGDADGRAGLVDPEGLWVEGVCASDPSGTPLLVAVDDGRTSLGVVAAVDPAPRPIEGMDPGLGLWSVRGRAADFEALGPEVVEPWQGAVDLARLGLAAQLDGLAGASLALAVEHVAQREQFGRPVGGFQAVQHRLAEVLVALEAGRAAITVAADAPSRLASMVAKSMAGRAASVAGASCLQALGGIGFTADNPLHTFVKRGLVLDRLLGGSRELPATIGAGVLASASVPRLVEL